MKTHKLALILFTISLLNGIADADEQASSEPSNTEWASASIRIYSDEQIPVSIHDLDDFLRDRVERRARQEITPDKGDSFFLKIDYKNSVTRKIGSNMMLPVRLSVKLPDSYPLVAKEYLLSCIENLEAELRDRYQSEKQLFEMRRQVLLQAVDQTEGTLRELQRQQYQVSREMPMDKQSVLRRQMEHRQALVENYLQLSVLKNRADELLRRIEETRVEIEEKIQNDNVLSLLEELFKQQQAEMEHIEQAYQAGSISEDEAAKTRERLIRAKIEMAQRKEQLQNEAGGQRIRELKRQFQETVIRIDELEAQQKILEGNDPGSLSRSNDYEFLEIKLNAAREDLHNAIMEKNSYERQINLIQPPTVRFDEISTNKRTSDSG